jgi:hypothetical protein
MGRLAVALVLLLLMESGVRAEPLGARRARTREAQTSKQSVQRRRMRERAARPRSLVVLPAPPPTRLAPPRLLQETTEQSPPSSTRRERRLFGIAPRASRLWVDSMAGVSRLVARRLDFERGVSQVETLAPWFRVQLGLRADCLTVGAFLGYALLSDASLSTSGISIGLRVPFARFEPSLRVAGGYAWEGRPAGRERADIRGFTVGAELGAALYVHRHVSVELHGMVSLVAVAAQRLDVNLGDPTSRSEARRKLERSSLARLSALGLSVAFHQ